MNNFVLRFQDWDSFSIFHVSIFSVFLGYPFGLAKKSEKPFFLPQAYNIETKLANSMKNTNMKRQKFLLEW